MSARASTLVANAIRSRTVRFNLGCATGSTPEGLYAGLVDLCKGGLLDLTHVSTFNLDEYSGLPAGHDQSYQFYMRRHLFEHVAVLRSFFPDLEVPYDGLISDAGGIDLQIVGIGANGHIGFNEPGSPFDSRTREVALAAQTIEDNSRFFSDVRQVPRRAVTMGIRTIMEARSILLIANGTGKSNAVAAALEGPHTELVPASCLQRHADVTVLLDEAAASKVQTRPDSD